MTTPREKMLDDTLKIVVGDRNDTYGDPYDDHRRTAAMWTAYLGVPITPEQVCICHVLVKVSRLAHTAGHTDSLIDISGWAANAYECVEFMKKED